LALCHFLLMRRPRFLRVRTMPIGLLTKEK
jgi:hypothetical protein